jgi:hypothetical protein
VIYVISCPPLLINWRLQCELHRTCILRGGASAESIIIIIIIIVMASIGMYVLGSMVFITLPCLDTKQWCSLASRGKWLLGEARCRMG